MATSKSKKKAVSKDDLRRLMKQYQTSTKKENKKIEHPLAKYNSLDQLVCVLCNCVIKSDVLWATHLLSRQHKEKLLTGTVRSASSTTTHIAGVKRKADTGEPTTTHKGTNTGILKSSAGLPSDFFDQPSGTKTNSALTAGLAAYSDSSSDEDEDDEPVTKATIKSTAASSTASGLPADFFDPVIPTSSVSKLETVPDRDKPGTMANALPEGFFDDPKMDAKIRQVEYKDKMEEEWDMFQRAMKEEAHVSEAIVDEDEEQANVERIVDEIDEQMQRWKEVNDLEEKREEIIKKGVVTKMAVDDNSDEELDEHELDEFLDWRSKKSWK